MNTNLSSAKASIPCVVDQTMRPLKVPPKFKPYMENHRIPELFSRLIKDIISEKPADILTFMKTQLNKTKDHAAHMPKIILLGPPHLDKLSLAYYVSDRLQCVPISLRDILFKQYAEAEHEFDPWQEPTVPSQAKYENEKIQNIFERDLSDENVPWIKSSQRTSMFSITPDFPLKTLPNPENKKLSEALNQLKSGELELTGELLKVLTSCLQETEVVKHGWILFDFPRNKNEARVLFKYNIVPTHVIVLSQNEISYNTRDFWNKNMLDWESDEQNLKTQENYLTLLETKEVYAHFIKDINVCGKPLSDVGDMILDIVGNSIHKPVQITPRVVILGTRGSGRRSLGDKLAKNLNLIHLNMSQKIFKETLMGREIDYDHFLSRLVEDDCLNNGYVITGLPRNVDEFVMLDRCENPPNRAIFLAINDEQCLKRLEDRCINIYTGDVLCRHEVMQNAKMHNSVGTHPDDDICKVMMDQRLYREEVTKMLKYCGDSAIVIDAACCFDIVYERVKNAILATARGVHVRNCDYGFTSVSEESSCSSSDELRRTKEKEVITCDLGKERFAISFKCTETKRNIREVLDEVKETEGLLYGPVCGHTFA